MSDYPDLWPDIQTEKDPSSPAAILEQQAGMLGAKTKNLVVGDVTSWVDYGEIHHSLHLEVPTQEYSYTVLDVKHSLRADYPVTFVIPEEMRDQKAYDKEEFTNVLREVLQSEETKRVLRSLLSLRA